MLGLRKLLELQLLNWQISTVGRVEFIFFLKKEGEKRQLQSSPISGIWPHDKVGPANKAKPRWLSESHRRTELHRTGLGLPTRPGPTGSARPAREPGHREPGLPDCGFNFYFYFLKKKFFYF